MSLPEMAVGLIASKENDDLIIEVCGPEYGAYVVSSRTSSGVSQYFGCYSRDDAVAFLNTCKTKLLRGGWSVLEFGDLCAAKPGRRPRARTL